MIASGNGRTCGGGRHWRVVHAAAVAALACGAGLARRSAGDIVNLSRSGSANISGEALSFTSHGILLQNESYGIPKSDQSGLGPIGFGFSHSINSIPGATASSSVSDSGVITLDLTAGTLTVTAGGTASASASETPPTPSGSNFTQSTASADASFVFDFTLTNRNYDYRIDLGNVAVNAPAGADTTASVFLGGSAIGFREALSSDEPPRVSGTLTGTLTPGTYGMSGSVDAFARSESSSASYGFTLTLTPSAPEFEWVNTAGGTFGTDSNWDPKHVPAASDAAVFDKPGNYVVSLDQDVQNQKVRADGAGVNVTIDLAGHTYAVNNLDVGDGVRLGFMDSGGIVAAARRARPADAVPVTLSVPGNMNVRGGGELDVTVPTSSGTFNVDDGGALTASGPNAQWLAQELLLGTHGTATCNISNKAAVTSRFASVGVGSTGNATVTVSDQGTAWSADSIVVGNQGTGSVSILHGGQVFAKSIVAGTSDLLGVGTITVDSGNSPQGPFSLLGDSNASGSLVIGDQGTGHLIVKGVGIVQVASLEVGRSFDGNGDVTITNPSSIVHAESLKVGEQGAGTVNVSNQAILATSEGRVGSAVIGTKGTVSLSTSGIWHANTALEVDGKLQIDSSSDAVVGSGFGSPGTLTILPGGTLSGTGTITVGKVVLAGGNSAFTGGILKPGHSPGTLTIDGDFEQSPNSTLKIEIAGTQPGQFDVLHVTGNASYAGDLLLSFQDGFAPKTGDAFAFVNTGGTVTGSFANVALHDVASGFQFKFQPQGGGFALVALNDAVSTRIPGDANDDGKVDFTDLLTLAQHYNQSATYSEGDFNLSGTVDFSDLLTLAQHYGQLSTTAAEPTFAVPEPYPIACIVAVLLPARRRSRISGGA